MGDGRKRNTLTATVGRREQVMRDKRRPKWSVGHQAHPIAALDPGEMDEGEDIFLDCEDSHAERTRRQTRDPPKPRLNGTRVFIPPGGFFQEHSESKSPSHKRESGRSGTSSHLAPSSEDPSWRANDDFENHSSEYDDDDDEEEEEDDREDLDDSQGSDNDGSANHSDPSESDEEEEDEEEEDEADYRRGGYHRVQVGELYNGRYRIERKLGWGHYSTVWRAYDSIMEYPVAIKFVKSASHYTDAALDEIRILSELLCRNPYVHVDVVHLLDWFYHVGPNGRHMCMVFEPLGMSLLDLIRRARYKGLPQGVVRNITRQVLETLAYVHSCHIIHTDLKPENILLVDPATALSRQALQEARVRLAEHLRNTPVSNGGWATFHSSDEEGRPVDSMRMNLSSLLEQGDQDMGDEGPARVVPWKDERLRIRVVDFGNACWADRHVSDDIQTRQYRSLEAILGASYGPQVDVWSVACIVFELLTGDMLFEPRNGAHFRKSDDHLAQIMETLGGIPEPIALSGRYSLEYFDRRGRLRCIRRLHYWPLREVLVEKYRWNDEDAFALARFLLPMLRYDPRKRISASEALNHPWILSPIGYFK